MIAKSATILLTFCCLAGLFTISSCTTDDEETTYGNWTKITPFKGSPRAGAISFTIDTKAFVGLGYDGDEYLSDFYVYDVELGFWSSLKNFPGTLRERAVTFSINGKGYIGLGYNRDLDKVELRDFWEYNPETDEWSRIADFGGTARYNAVGFAIGSLGYVGTGYDGKNYNSDFWQFDPQENSWTEIISFPGEKIESGFAFVIGGNAYIGAGRNNGSYSTNFWEFTPGIDGAVATWTKRTPSSDKSYYDDFKGAMYRYNAVAVTSGMKAFIVGGVASSGAVSREVYEFDAATFAWTDRTAFEGSSRSLAVGFGLSNRIFVGTGLNGSSRYDDVWEFKPEEEYDEDN
ncbi:MAG: galactose oxidase [Cyclobacteriaceae bacterium]|nr:galactose oxidase [Cyclobacteriaceae bacterium]